MFYLFRIPSASLDLGRISMDAVAQYGYGIGLISGATRGSFLLPPLKPQLVEYWEGCTIEGADESQVEVALRDPSGESDLEFVDGAWQWSSAPVYQSLTLLRSRLPVWSRPVQLRVRINRPTAQDPTPLITSVVVGFHSRQSLLNMLLFWALPQALAVPVEMSRIVTVGMEGNTLVPPNDVNLSAISNVFFKDAAVGGRHSVAVANNTLVLPYELTPETPGHLLFDYFPEISAVDPQESPQLSSTPTVLVRFADRTDTRHLLSYHDWVQINPSKALVWQAARTFEALVDIVVFARDITEAWAIADQLQSLLSRGYVYVPQLDVIVPIMISEPAHLGPASAGDAEYGNLRTVSIQIRCLNIPEGVTSTESAIFIPPQST